MTRLFGLDIAAIVNASIKSAGGLLPATLIKVSPTTRDPGDLPGGTNAEERSYACQGMIEHGAGLSQGSFGEASAGDMYRQERGIVVTLLGASIEAGKVPEPGDRVTIEGVAYEVRSVSSDPARATYDLVVFGL